MKLYPLFADLSQRAVLVLGGGAVAERKVAALLAAQALVTVNAPALSPRLRRWADQGLIAYRPQAFQPDWLDAVWLLVAATSDQAMNREVAAAAMRRRIFANVVDDAALSSFHVPAVVDRSPLTIAISSGGAAPMLARLLRERLETALDESLGALATLAAKLRKRIRLRFPEMAGRRGFYEHLFAGPVATLLRQGRPNAAWAAAEQALASMPIAGSGSVVLVGAGPGDPGLLTLRALRALNEADVVLHDRLVSAGVLELARRDAQRIEVGKQAGHHHTTQDGIHALLLAHARAGKRVVRLKGGDSFVFGRGGEELECLRRHGIAYEVVPGITAAVACAAYAGVPLTHREHAQSVRFVTAHCRSSLDTLDWAALAQERQTLAVYMGVAELGTLQARLIAHGRAATTPFALIENGTRAEQRVVTGTLAKLADGALEHAVCSPALLILGEVAALASSLAWFGEPPLTATVESASAPLACRPSNDAVKAPRNPACSDSPGLTVYFTGVGASSPPLPFSRNIRSTPMIYESILDTIGNTPIVKLHRLAPKQVTVYVKVEAFNPAGSVKDRLALAIVLDAEKRGTLKPGQTVIEATSGNTGVALAAVCAARGYPFVAVMSETFSVERRKLIRAYGGKVLLTPAAARGSGMVVKAEELAKKHGWFLARQFENEANPAYHRNTTGPEILRDFAGKRLDYFVSGWGTGGTLTGVGEVLQVARPEVKIIATEPAGAALLAGKEWQPHRIQGWNPDFIPKVLKRSVADDIVLVDDVLARDTSRALAQQEGIFVGISAGATLAAALKVAKSAPAGAVLLAMLPDTGERYLSTFLFEGVNEGSDDVE